MKVDTFVAHIRNGLAHQASDLFLIPGEAPIHRIKGLITRTEGEIIAPEETAELVSSLFGEEQVRRLGSELGELHRSFDLPGQSAVRVCAARSQGACTLSAQLAWPVICSAETIRLPQTIIDATSRHYGLIVFSGLAGSGKSTSAYSLVDYLNENWAGHICTIEDPIACRFTPKKSIVQQREVGVDVPDCLSGIAAAMRQDLDVLFVTDIPDYEALEACFRAAETGHLVILVLHSAASPEEAIERMVDAFPEDLRDSARRLLAHYLMCISTQILLRPKGGWQGPAYAAYGVLIPDEEMREAIALGKNPMQRTTNLPEGCQTVAEHVERMVKEGIVQESVAREALRRTPF